MAADTFKIKRGTTAAVNAYLADIGEPVLDITLHQLHIGDGVTPGGIVVGTLTTAFMASLLDDTDASAARLTLGAAPLASPTFTGVPAGPTASPGTNTTQLATTAFVEAVRTILVAADALKAPLASPALTGVPTAPTAAIGTNTTQLATMAALQARILGTVSQSGGVPTGAIIESGTNANGTYVKWADGTMMCRRREAVTRTLNGVNGALFGSASPESALSWAQTFTGVPEVNVSATGDGTVAAIWAGIQTATASLTPTGIMYAVTSQASKNYSITYTAWGRWF